MVFNSQYDKSSRLKWCWWQRHVGDFMMVTRCWRQKDNIGDVFRYVTDAFNIIGRSSTSQSCHKHIPSPTSVTNIDVATNCNQIYVHNITSMSIGLSIYPLSRLQYISFWIWKSAIVFMHILTSQRQLIGVLKCHNHLLKLYIEAGAADEISNLKFEFERFYSAKF